MRDLTALCQALLLALVAWIGFCPHAALAQAHEAWQAPTLTITRADEDWSDLEDPVRRARHWTGPFKYIPITDDIWLSTGTEFRLRNENYHQNLWGDAEAPDDSYLWLRAMPYADLHAGHARVFVQPIASYAIGVAPRASPIDKTGIDLLQGFAEIREGPVTLRAGRQMLSLGTERLVGTRYGPNTPLAFDGLRARIKAGPATLDLLAVRPVTPGLHSLDDSTSDTQELWGLYATGNDIDAYYLGYRNDDAQWLGDTGRETRHTLGMRWHAMHGDWHWNLEGAYQFGHFAGQTISAWTLASELGRSFPGLPASPAVTFRLNAASGDGNRGDATLGTFNALFPKGKYFGELSPVGPYNIINAFLQLGLQPARSFAVSLASVSYWRFSRADGIYDIPGHLLRNAGASRARFIGNEGELTVSWQATAELELSGSLSLFAPGAFIHQTGSSHTIVMSGLEANFRF